MLGLNVRLQNIGLVNNAKVPHNHVLFIGLVDVRENKAHIERGEKNSSEGKNSLPPPPPLPTGGWQKPRGGKNWERGKRGQ